MLPEQPISYPEFVADQLLTANNLNELFNYLDEQERGTRINLIGIGIVCGLELSVNSAGTSITISKGCGITSAGYLVRWDEATFENYKAYDAVKEIVYAPQFVSGGVQKFAIDELKSNSSEEGITKITSGFLANKVVLLFVELLEIDSKNCDPESCDDKGKNITLTIRPLLVDKKAAIYLTGGVAGSSSFNQTWVSLPEIRMPRHHLPAADIFDSGDVLEGFQKVLSLTFLKDLESKLTQTYLRVSPLVKDIYASNPFTGMANGYAFITNGTMTAEQMLYMQYYYDLFSDIIYAYEELRKVGTELMSLCCPNEGLFPRHLLLGLAVNTVSEVKSDFRHYFIPSPAVCCHGKLVNELRTLFKRIVLLLQRFDPKSAQQFQTTNNVFTNIAGAKAAGLTVPIRITPSKYGDIPLSIKSIPFYYNVTGGSDKLLQHWNYRRGGDGTENKNLSYHAVQWAGGDDSVLNPLHYDLEPYNFLRIEGHVGHSYVEALATINNIRDTNRLPFDVVALSADIITLREQIAAIAGSVNNAGLRDGFQSDISMMCHFQDLEAQYDVLAQGLLCNLCKEMKYYYNPASIRSDVPADKIPTVPLLKKCDPSFRFRANSLGDLFEQFWAKVANQPYMSPDQIVNANFGTLSFGDNQRVNGIFNLLFALLYYIEKVSEILPTTLIAFNLAAFLRRYTDLLTVAQKLKELYLAIEEQSENQTIQQALTAEDFLDHLDALLYACKDAQLSALYNDYKTRWVYLAMLQKFGYYVKMHPGIQHKAGVPMGGTFIMVYHDRSRIRKPDTTIFTKDNAFRTTAAVARDINITAPPPEAVKKSTAGTNAEKEAKAEGIAGAAPGMSGDAESLNQKAGATGMKTTEQLTNINATYAGIRQLDINKLKAQLTQKQLSVIDRLFYKPIVTRHTLDELTAQLPDNMVIADFYLPYMCCSDCPPVYFIVNEVAEEDPIVPTISIKQNQFCNDDKGAYPIDVTPAGGTVSGEGVQAANGAFTFNPSAAIIDGVPSKVIPLTYTKDGASASVNVTVFAKPKAQFEVIPGTTYTLFIFSNEAENAASVSWDFGDGITSTADNPAHNYTKDGVYVVTLTAVNGICSDTISKTINVSQASVSVPGKEFCNADTRSYPISVKPDGGQLSGEGVSGTSFIPSSVKLDAGVGSKDVTISYTIPGQFTQTTVKVFQSPSAVFTVKDSASSGNIKVFSTSNNSGVQYSWDFGDGSSSVEANPTHQYAAPGDYIVKLTVTNGPCTTSTSQTINIVQASVSITPGSFCSADKASYPFATSPSGGTISGEGTVTTGTGFAFKPGNVAFQATQAQKSITIGYAAGGQTAQTQVTVFQTPNASFTINNATALNTKIFGTNIGFPATFSWDFGDGGTSTLPGPSHQYTKGGTFTVKLSVTNGNCNAESSQTLTINVEGQPQKTCGPLSGVIAEFKDLEKLNAAQFKSFTTIYKSYEEVSKYFALIEGISGQTATKQIDFFVSTDVAQLLEKWFNELNSLVQSSDVRTISLAMWQTLTDLAMYIMCIQDGDFDKIKINLADLFKKLESFINGWIEFIKNFTKVERGLVVKLQADITSERDRVINNGESNLKKNYFAELNILIDILKTILK